MSRRKKKPTIPGSPSDELGEVIDQETGISLGDLESPISQEDTEDASEQLPALPSPETPAIEQPSVAVQQPNEIAAEPDPLDVPAIGDEDQTGELLGLAHEYGKESVWGRIVPTLVGVLVAVVVIAVIGMSVVAFRLLDARSQAQIAQQSFDSIEKGIATLDFRSALEEFPKGRVAIHTLTQRIGEFQFADSVPLIGAQLRESYAALRILDQIFTSGEQLLSIVNEMGAIIFRENGDKTFELYMKTLSIDEKGKILRMITEAVPTLNGVKASLQLSLRDIDTLDQSKISNQLRDALLKAKNGAEELQSIITAWLPLAEVVPSFLGYPDEKTYLLLLQDTSELRATGGFISQYGILKIKNGEIVELRTDNVYNLDDRAAQFVSLPPPGPFQHYSIGTLKKWFLRDSNWSPDFSESARQAEGLYHLEGGRESHIDGVLAATPEFVRSILQFTGPIRIEGREYNADNLLENLAFEIREGNYRRGIAESDRKEIFGQLIAKIGEKLLEIPLTRWTELYKLVETRLNEKNLLLYFHESTLQHFAEEHKWAGEIDGVDSDFLMVVDTTMGTLKTESVMEKKVNYTMREDQDGFLVGRVELIYTNNGTFSDVTTRYRDWVRILVPAGSTLVRSTGAQSSENQKDAGTLEITQEHGKMQFGAFISVEPRYSKVFTIEYRLPNRLYDRVKQGEYTLFVQKQPGDTHKKFQGDLMFLSPVADYSPLGFFNAKQTPNSLELFSDLRTDQEFSIRLKKKEAK